eukprot:1985247-Rhodomonas_salina.1
MSVPGSAPKYAAENTDGVEMVWSQYGSPGMEGSTASRAFSNSSTKAPCHVMKCAPKCPWSPRVSVVVTACFVTK